MCGGDNCTCSGNKDSVCDQKKDDPDQPARCGPLLDTGPIGPNWPPGPCQCPKGACCCMPMVKKCMRYVQPEKPKSFKPETTYCKPDMPFEDWTIYRRSYMPVEGERQRIVKTEDNLRVGEGKMSDKTVHNMSYQCTKACPPCPIVPCSHNLLGTGPMQDITTHKHDYVPKPFSKPEINKIQQNIFTSKCPLTDKTTHRMSYMPVDMCKFEPAKLVRPEESTLRMEGKMNNCTVHRMSYLPWDPPERPDMPWADKGEYRRPCCRMSGDTVYNNSYLPNCCVPPREPIKPSQNSNPLDCEYPFEDWTIYRRSYMPVEGERPKITKAEDNLRVGEGKMSDKTVHNMSYQCTKACPPCPIVPCSHNLLGTGPMQDITTHKHDYVPKPYSKAETVKTPQNIFTSKCPLTDKTTHRMSYMPIDLCKVDPVKVVRPEDAIERNQGKMSNCTVHRMSYLPWEAPDRPDMPWADKTPYKRPTKRMEGCTVYNMSYDAPGDFVEAECQPGCFCIIPGQCACACKSTPCTCFPTAAC